MHRRSYNLPGSARIREAFQRLKWAGAFGCQEIQVGKAFELVMEGSELPESSRSGHQTSSSDSMVRELSPPLRGAQGAVSFMMGYWPSLSFHLAVPEISHFLPEVLNLIPSNSTDGGDVLDRRQACLLRWKPTFCPQGTSAAASAVFSATQQHGKVLVPRRHLLLHTLLHAASKT